MGNQIENNANEEMKLQIKVYKKKSNKQNIVNALPPPKMIFTYIKPIKFNDDDMCPLEEINTTQKKVKSPQFTFNMINIVNNIECIKNGKAVQRTIVKWKSFLRIKNQNYLDDYKFIQQIGKGGFGTVNKIKMKHGGISRAAKVIKHSQMLKQQIQKKLCAQVQIPNRLDHPNILKLLQVYSWRNQLVLITQLCQGGDLFQRVKKCHLLSQIKVADIMRQILSGVVYLHNNNIVHRDLKLENILYDNQSKHLKIIDFGASAQFTPNKPLDTIIGTAYYIAPQVISGSYNQKCDIWSCGVILYILLSGSPPFSGKTQQQIMHNIQIQQLQFQDRIWTKRSIQAVKLIISMLKKNPSSRISAIQALNSPWILNTPTNEQKQCDSRIIQNLKNFNFKNKIKAVVYTYIASQLYSSKDKQSLLKIFREIDTDNNGVIQKQQLFRIFNSCSKSNLTQQQIENIIKIIDTNGSGLIDYTQFLVAASKQSQLLEKKRLENAFEYLDKDHSGYISVEEIKLFLDGTNQTADEIKKIFQQVDTNGDGVISKKQFLQLLLKKN